MDFSAHFLLLGGRPARHGALGDDFSGGADDFVPLWTRLRRRRSVARTGAEFGDKFLHGESGRVQPVHVSEAPLGSGDKIRGRGHRSAPRSDRSIYKTTARSPSARRVGRGTLARSVNHPVGQPPRTEC